MKSSVYRNAAVTACALGLLGLLVGCWEMTVSFEATDPDTSSGISIDMPQLETNLALPSSSTEVTNTTEIPNNSPVQKSEQTNSILAARQSLAGNTKIPGKLRMSNQTEQPVRLALLPRQSGNKSSTTKQADIPAHWDFDPQEGSEKGLILSLPNGSLKLDKGDVLVAFAQDGSRRYWGPYVVGETSQPSWNSQSQEWVLVLSQ
ncbi:hypothetical protein [Anabaena subtropica]|uniref:Uncharacterized protein n=1 Tax=Anabaena subtropica FACHB-260 TaxID=2692884 RepID=A0ABR8CMU2_9NOST|nr:hypothetical protein [Anabaena subtropica]MBD2343497.1 hypothetical protein [Anabaena subtropica FACHB-260]